MTPEMVQLPNGDWVRKQDLVSIKLFDESDSSYGLRRIPCRVVVVVGNSYHVFEQTDIESGWRFRDEMARLFGLPEGRKFQALDLAKVSDE